MLILFSHLLLSRLQNNIYFLNNTCLPYFQQKIFRNSRPLVEHFSSRLVFRYSCIVGQIVIMISSRWSSWKFGCMGEGESVGVKNSHLHISWSQSQKLFEKIYTSKYPPFRNNIFCQYSGSFSLFKFILKLLNFAVVNNIIYSVMLKSLVEIIQLLTNL